MPYPQPDENSGFWENYTIPLTNQEKIEIADYVINLWQQFRSNLQKEL